MTPDLIDFEILGGLEYSAAEKENLVAQAYELGLDLNDFETWEALQYTGHDQGRKSVFDFVGIDTECNCPFLRAGVPIHPPKPGELV